MKLVRLVAAGAALLMLTSCFLQPGKFTSAMTVMKDGSFTYSYTGEIHLVTYKSMMKEMMQRGDGDMGEFNPDEARCWDDQPSYTATDAAADAAVADAAAATDSANSTAAIDVAADDEMSNATAAGMSAADEGRPCTPEELAEKKKQWDEERAAQAERRSREDREMKEMFGGMDPSDPKTLDEFARRLQGQAGWKKVVHKGDGVFEVDYEIAGRLDHDFIFPVYPGFRYVIPFVTVTRRADGRLHMLAPAFVGSPSEGGMNGAMGLSMMGMGGGGATGGMVVPNGTFTFKTDAEIVTNNTQDGPTVEGGLKALTWIVGPLDSKMPEVLLKP